MNFLVGRQNMALTVFVPYDCTNNCSFCTTKCLYKNPISTVSAEANISNYLKKAEKSSHIKDIVFTGGEPMMDIEMLTRFCKLIPSKDIYINTNLIKENFFDFVKLVNKTTNIKGVNISRHQISPDDEPKNQVEDWCLQAFEKPLRINIVIPSELKDSTEFISFVEKIMNRWNYQDVTVNFRVDYRTMTSSTLHTFDDEFVAALLRNYDFVDHRFCDVCDSVLFNDPVMNKSFMYHRGLAASSINLRSSTIINDIILFPKKTKTLDDENNYELCYDWEHNTDHGLEDFIFNGEGKKKSRKSAAAPRMTMPVYSGPYERHC